MKLANILSECLGIPGKGTLGETLGDCASVLVTEISQYLS